MSKQVIFVIEADSKSQSDEVCLNEIIDYYYPYVRMSEMRVCYAYMGGNSRFDSNSVVTQIKKHISFGNNNEFDSVVLYVVDTDNLVNNAEQRVLFNKIVNYCAQNEYELIWFNQNVEHVLTNNRIVDDKVKHAKIFRGQEGIKLVSSDLLKKAIPTARGSNILVILEKIFQI